MIKWGSTDTARGLLLCNRASKISRYAKALYCDLKFLYWYQPGMFTCANSDIATSHSRGWWIPFEFNTIVSMIESLWAIGTRYSFVIQRVDRWYRWNGHQCPIGLIGVSYLNCEITPGMIRRFMRTNACCILSGGSMKVKITTNRWPPVCSIIGIPSLRYNGWADSKMSSNPIRIANPWNCLIGSHWIVPGNGTHSADPDERRELVRQAAKWIGREY